MVLPSPCGRGGRGPGHCRSRGGGGPRGSGGKDQLGTAVRTASSSLFSASLSISLPLSGGGGCAAGKLSAPLPPPAAGRDGTGRWVRLCQAPADTGRDGAGEPGAAVSGGWGRAEGVRGRGTWAGPVSGRGARGPEG